MSTSTEHGTGARVPEQKSGFVPGQPTTGLFDEPLGSAPTPPPPAPAAPRSTDGGRMVVAAGMSLLRKLMLGLSIGLLLALILGAIVLKVLGPSQASSSHQAPTQTKAGAPAAVGQPAPVVSGPIGDQQAAPDKLAFAMEAERMNDIKSGSPTQLQRDWMSTSTGGYQFDLALMGKQIDFNGFASATHNGDTITVDGAQMTVNGVAMNYTVTYKWSPSQNRWVTVLRAHEQKP